MTKKKSNHLRHSRSVLFKSNMIKSQLCVCKSSATGGIYNLNKSHNFIPCHSFFPSIVCQCCSSCSFLYIFLFISFHCATEVHWDLLHVFFKRVLMTKKSNLFEREMAQKSKRDSLAWEQRRWEWIAIVNAKVIPIHCHLIARNVISIWLN